MSIASFTGEFEAHIKAIHDEIEDLDVKQRRPFEKIAARMTKTLAELKGRSDTAVAVSVPVDKKSKKAKKMASDSEGVTDKPKRAPNASAVMLKRISPDITRILDGKKATGPIQMLKIVGRLRSNGITEPSDDEIRSAIDYLIANPDHLSATQSHRSAKSSVEGESSEKPKQRGRPSKTKKAAATKAAETPAPTLGAGTGLREELEERDESEESESEEDDEEDENTHLEQWTWKGEEYLKDLEQEVYTSFGEMQWIGTFNGKKIVKRDMPERVRKFLTMQN